MTAMLLPDLKFTLKFTCELAPKKQEWLLSATHANTCCFTNIIDMKQEQAYCARHLKNCKIPRVNIIIVGLSCKDLSKMNINAKKHKSILSQQVSAGGTATTFRGLLAFLDAHGCDIILGEEVEELADMETTGDSNLNIMQCEISNRGFELQAVLVDNVQWGLPCRRKRLYFICIAVASSLLAFGKSHGVNETFQKFTSCLAMCQRLLG